MDIQICGTGSALPKLRVTNDDLSKIMDTSGEWIKTRTGIRARHIATEETTLSLSVEAAVKAIREAGIEAEELDLIIAATVSPDHILPSLACEVQRELGAVHAVAFDIGAACSGFLFALGTAQAYIASGRYRNALLIGAEVLSKMMDWNDRSTCVLFGDGAGAAVVKADENGFCHVVQGSDGARGMVLSCKNRPVNNPFIKQYSGSSNVSEHACKEQEKEFSNPSENAFEEQEKEFSNPSENAFEEQENALSYVSMNGQEVYKFAVRTVPASINRVLEEAGLTADDISLFVLHQANLRILEAVAKRLGQPMDKFPVNLTECGNISAASVPILLDKINQSGMIQRGDKIVLAGFGAGLTWGAAVLTW